jgi:lipid A 3-O-deacylase
VDNDDQLYLVRSTISMLWLYKIAQAEQVHNCKSSSITYRSQGKFVILLRNLIDTSTGFPYIFKSMLIFTNLFKIVPVIVIFLILSDGSKVLLAQEVSAEDIPARYGLAGVIGKTFDPVTDIYFVQLSGFIMWDYDRVWRHWAPDPLRFKVEGNAGVTTSPEARAMISIGMMALYYLDFLSTARLRPYLEGGIGVIYTDFQVKGQGSRFNFNPQIGIGSEFKLNSGATFFATTRLSHISNAGLHSENRGVNFVVLTIGRFF